MDAAGHPLLIEPTLEDPWDHLYFEAKTGNIAPRFNREADEFDVRGEYTVRALELNHEAVTDGRLVTRRNLQTAIALFLESQRGGAPTGLAIEELRLSIQQNADHGLSVWYFYREGAEERPFSDLRHAYGDVWAVLQAAV